jgi:hypothetical protein
MSRVLSVVIPFRSVRIKDVKIDIRSFIAGVKSPRGSEPDRLLSISDVKRAHEQIEYWVRLGMAADKVLSKEGIRRLLLADLGPTP